MSDFDWQGLKDEILADMTAGMVLSRSYSFKGQQREFRALSEVLAFLNYIDGQIAQAASATGHRAGGVARFRESC